jgi:Mn-dependent DtxR family transcriptional regulator
MGNDSFHTFGEYMKKYSPDVLTASMEDYLEMIFRLSEKTGFSRIHDLAQALNVQPPSASKMVQKLSELKLIDYEKYGIIILTSEGKKMGSFLLNRHNIIEKLIKILGVTENVLEETEKIEHTISNITLECFLNFTEFIDQNPDVLLKMNSFLKNKSEI